MPQYHFLFRCSVSIIHFRFNFCYNFLLLFYIFWTILKSFLKNFFLFECIKLGNVLDWKFGRTCVLSSVFRLSLIIKTILVTVKFILFYLSEIWEELENTPSCNGTSGIVPAKKFVFNRQASKGEETDLVQIINVPMMVIVCGFIILN